jgi:predicted nucleic acid-binding protein
MAEGTAVESFTSHYIQTAREVCAGYGDFDHAFVSGSLLEGFGNGMSDLDLYIVKTGERGGSQDADHSVILEDFDVDLHHRDGLRVDVEIWTAERMRVAMSAILDCSVAAGAAVTLPPETWLQLAHRVRIGIPVVGAERFEELRSLLDARHLSRVLATWFLSAYNNSAEDAIGAIHARDHGTALLTSRLCYGAAVDATSALRGMTNPKAKWRYAKLRALGGDDLVGQYIAAELDGSTDPGRILTMAKRRLREANSLALAVQTELSAGQ